MLGTDPYRAFRFRVEINALEVGGFQSVSGLERDTKIEPYRQGGVNDYEEQHAGVTTYPRLKLKRGLADPMLWAWHQAVILGLIQRAIMSVVLLGRADRAWRWIFLDAYRKVEGADSTQRKASRRTVDSSSRGWSGVKAPTQRRVTGARRSRAGASARARGSAAPPDRLAYRQSEGIGRRPPLRFAPPTGARCR